MLHEVAVRQGGPQDTGLLIDLFDDAVAWLVARGQPEQWRSESFSRRADGRRRARDLAGGGGLFVAQNRQEPVGLLVVGDAPEYAPAIDRPELYIELLLTARRHAGNALGTRPIDVAIREARAAKREVVRVDCWAGAPKLVNWYEQQGVHANRTPRRDGRTAQWSIPFGQARCACASSNVAADALGGNRPLGPAA